MSKPRVTWILAAVLAFLAGTAATAQQATVVEHPPSARASASLHLVANPAVATIADFSWLTGKWRGTWGPRVAEQVWMEPNAGTVVGLLRLEDSRTLVIELFSLVEKSGGVELRTRHFTPSLAPWEHGEASLLILTGIDAKSATFDNDRDQNPQRMIFTRVDPDTFISRSELGSNSADTQTTEITYHRENAVTKKRSRP